MADFLEIRWRTAKKGIEVYPSFVVKSRSNDLMIRGRDFYAVWDEETGLWSMDEDDAIAQVDRALDILAKEKIDKINAKGEKDGTPVDEREKVYILKMRDSDSGVIDKWHKYVQRQMRDHYHALDEKIIFSNQKTKKTDYASKRLSYAIGEGDISAYDELMNTLYDPSERAKLEWAIGAIISGDAKRIQKFIVMYGSPGSGKSTVLNIIQDLFEDYVSIFDAKELASSNNSFALESFNSNPLVSIQHDGDLSRIEDNTRLNSIVSHETMVVNEKFKSKYNAKFNTFLFMGTNRPVQITESKSGLTRRLIDVYPSERRLPRAKYNKLVKDIKFELGAIAQHCLDVYNEMGENYYDSYIPERMIKATNPIYDFIDYSYLDILDSSEDGITLKELWTLYSAYVDGAKIRNPLKRNIFADEMRNYFAEYYEQARDSNGGHVRSLYKNFLKEKFEKDSGVKKEDVDIPKKEGWLKFDFETSIFDEARQDSPAQLANKEGTPTYKWENVKTHLCDINTKELHYVKIPEEEIVIDFDIKDNNGNKSYEKNLKAATKFPPTYAELSKSGSGIHLHYLYSGDVSKLSRIYADDIEIKVFTGNSSLRRKLTKCNDISIATISSGLPLKGEKNVINFEAAKSERALRERIKRCLNKEHHGATAPEVNFIFKELEDAYNSGLVYDVTDMRQAVLSFATNSTHQANKCIKLVTEMHFASKDKENSDNIDIPNDEVDEAKLVFYDIEVFPNLFIVCWKMRGKENPVNRMINPLPNDIKDLVSRYNLVGFNNRRYDNHILYARMQGYSNEEIYRLSQRIVEGSRNAFFLQAYNLSYTDVYDFCAKKQSLKKWEIELGIHHQELGLRWDEPVEEKLWTKVAEYCDNDVIATEATFDANQADWTARKILADIAGMTPNSTTNSLTTRIIFGTEKKPDLIYTDLATGRQWNSRGNELTPNPNIINSFPGYEYTYNQTTKKSSNMFMGTDVGFGGYVYAEPGMYNNVALLDVASMHPTSAINLNIFGEHTKDFKDILDARLFIKHKDYKSAGQLFGGRLKKYLNDTDMAKSLAQALKIAINSVYGLTSAGFDNPFRDTRNKNNIVALRGALFMRMLQEEVKNRGFTVAHIKTDSIKIPNATNDIIQFVIDFGHKYGYNFEHEATYRRMCLVNNSVYIAQYADNCEWTATGAQFAVPYVFKKLFSKEDIEFKDLCETKTVSSALYLDMNEGLPDVRSAEKELDKVNKKISAIDETNYGDSIDLIARKNELIEEIQKGHNYVFVGKAGLFCPIKPGRGGGELLREIEPGKYGYANDTSGYRWLESEMVQNLGKENDIDTKYYEELANSAIEDISKFGDFYQFVSEDFIDIADQTPTF